MTIKNALIDNVEENNKANGKENKKNDKDNDNLDNQGNDNINNSDVNVKKNNRIKQLFRKTPVRIFLAIAVMAVSYWGVTYWKTSQEQISIEKAQIMAPSIQLGPGNTGVLKKVFVSDGDFVKANTLIAIVGDEYIRSKITGIVTGINDSPGQIFSRGQWVATMIDPKEIRVVGRIAEDKGLKDVYVGQHVVFTVDAFGNQEFNGEVESVSETSREGDVVFSISDKREEKEFNIKVQFDHDAYSQFRNGMSARLRIIKGQ